MTSATPCFSNSPASASCRRAGHRLRSALAAFVLLGAGALRAQLNITRQPEALVVPSGQPATLSVGVTASPAPTYQWRRYGYAIPGATNASYQIPAVSQSDNDYYDVVISSGGTTAVSQTARLLVTLRSYPGALMVDLPRSLRLEGPENNSTGIGPPFVQAALADGRFYLVGGFSSIDGQEHHDLVRFNANGTVDVSFMPPAFDATPGAIAVQPDGKVVLTGSFKTVGGVASSGIVRLNADGSRDTSFVVGAGFSNGLAGSLFVAPNGSIYVSGYFLGTYQGSPPLGYIARLTSTGALDPTFTSPTFAIGNSGTNPSGFAFGAAGEIYVHGGFDLVNGVSRHRIARLLPTGEVDPSFNPASGPNNWIYAMVVLSSGKIAIAGDFTAYNGTPVGHIARINSNGTLDTTFATGSGFAQQVNFLAELPGNALFVGSVFNTFNGSFVSQGVRLTANGALDTSFTYAPTGRPDTLSLLPGNRLLVSGGLLNNLRPALRVLEANGAISTAASQPAFRFPARARLLAPLPGGKVLVAGDFSQVNGSPVPFVMRLNADLTRDATFPNGRGPTTQVTNGVVQPDGKIVLFTYDGMMRLNADGSTDSSFVNQSVGGFWFPAPPVVLRDGRLFVPTDSSTWWGGSAVTNGFVVLESNGTRATSHPYLPGPNAGTRITGVQRLPAGQLLVTGSFTSWNGIPRTNAVRLNADGSVDPGFVPDGAFPLSPFLPALARNGWSVQRDGKLIATSEAQPGDTFARFNFDGTRDRSFVSGLPRLFSAGRFFVQPDDRIVLVAQDEPSIDPNIPVLFYRLTPTGAVDGSFKIRGSKFWQEAMLADNGELISSDSTGYLHRYAALPPPAITVQPSAQSVVSGTSIVLRVTATGDEPLAYQWFKDGVVIAGATGVTLALDNTAVSAAGAYSVVVSNAGGSVTSQAAAVSVSARPLAGVAFGAIAGSTGTFALYVREDGTGAFLAYLRDTQTVFVGRNLAIGADRRFRFQVAATSGAGAGNNSDVEGVIAADGSVAGTLLGRSFNAPPATTSGSTNSLVGFYETREANGSSLSYTIVGANGAAFTVATGSNLALAGNLTVDATGNLTGSLEDNTRATGAVQSSLGLASITLAATSGRTLAFSGADVEKRNDVEKLINISTRSVIAAGGSFTAGFVVTGDRAKLVLVRAVGPGLSAFAVDGVLPAARLEMFRGTTSIAVGDDWGLAPNATAIAATAVRVGAFALAPASRDAALLLSLEPGSYSARVTGQAGATGVALVEVYDATDGPIPRAQRIVNVSTLALAGSGSNTLTAGFYVTGLVPKRLLIRGVGPALTPFGVTGVLARPQVAVYSGTTVLAQNAGWSQSPDAAVLALAATQVAAFPFPAGSADAALVLNLSPGAYSAQVSGAGGATGTALVEVYELP